MAFMQRCDWAGDDPLYVHYHDHEWGVPAYDDRHLFEMLSLEGAQAGLSWITILRKRETYRLAFDQFEATKIVRYDDDKVTELLQNPGIVRNRLKVRSVIQNARGFLALQEAHGSFSTFVWQFVDGTPVINHWATMADVPAETDASRAMSKALKQHGFKFVGPTICYAFMQACGMVNDHLVTCFRYTEA
ncbi:MAG: DNA-3-methyladenine glycosylase I [Caldilineaceae bacterium]|nr:DNA-3-methyladenine glycosylase I [Caldilineaceae bacterium]